VDPAPATITAALAMHAGLPYADAEAAQHQGEIGYIRQSLVLFS
jgi:hypothetical protein